MKVILTESVKNVGSVGEIVNVTDGFGRNFILPNKLGVVANAGNQNALEDQRKALVKKMAEEKADAMKVKKKLDGLILSIEKKVGGSGKLFGTVTTSELSKLLAEKEIEVEKRLIYIENPIKQIGNFTVVAKLFNEVEASFNVEVKKDAKQIEDEKKKEKQRLESKAKRDKEAKEKAADETQAAANGAEGEDAESEELAAE
jgi:large subunit ribosomal protein L9